MPEKEYNVPLTLYTDEEVASRQTDRKAKEIEEIAKYNIANGTHFWNIEQVRKDQLQKETEKSLSENRETVQNLRSQTGRTIIPTNEKIVEVNALQRVADETGDPALKQQAKQATANLAKETGIGMISALTAPLIAGEFGTYGLWGGGARLLGGTATGAAGSFIGNGIGQIGDRAFGTTWMAPTGKIIGGFAGFAPGMNAATGLLRNAAGKGITMRMPQETFMNLRGQYFDRAAEKALLKANASVNPVLKSTIDHLYKEYPELAAIGPKDSYQQYYQTIFPASKVQLPYAHGTKSDLSKGLEASVKVPNAAAPETIGRNDFYLNLQPEASLQYADGINVPSGFTWNKHRFWPLKEILGKPYKSDSWMSKPIKLREQVPNRAGQFSRVKNADGTYSGHGKLLEEYKAELGMQDLSNEEFLQRLGVQNEESFNQWVAKNKQMFSDIYDSGDYHGLYHVKIDASKPLTIKGGNTYYSERGIWDRMNKGGNDVLLHNNAANEFGSDVAIVRDVTPQKVRILGSKPDQQGFIDFMGGKQRFFTETPISPQEAATTYHFDERTPLSRPISEAEKLGIPKGERSNLQALEDPYYWGYQQWNQRYNAAVKAGDMEEAQRLRDLHFRLHAKNNVIVDESGMPIEVYHGSPEEFNIFDYTRAAKYPEGHFFFGEDFDYARSHARKRAFTENNKDYNVKSYYLYDTEKYPINKNKIDPKVVPIVTDRQGYPLENELWSDSASYIMTHFQDKPHIIYGYDVGRDFIPGKYDYAVPFNTQMKLTDPITYNKGEIIPIVKRDNFRNPDIRYKHGGIVKAQPGTIIGKSAASQFIPKKLFELVAKRSNGAQTKSIPTIVKDVITGRDKSFYNEDNINGSNEIDTYLYGKPYNSEFTGDASAGADYTNYINKNYPGQDIKTYNTHFGDTLYIDSKAKDLVKRQLESGEVVGGSMGRYAHAPSYIITKEEGRPYDAGGHLIKFGKDATGNIVANMSDIYDFNPSDFNGKYDHSENPSWVRTFADKIGTPFIVRQNNIPVKFKEMVPKYKTPNQERLGDFLSEWGDRFDLSLPFRLSDAQINEIFDGRDYGDDILNFMRSKNYIK